MKLTITVPGGMDIGAVRFDYMEVTCGDTRRRIRSFTRTVDIQSSQTSASFDSNSQHFFAEDVAVVTAGCYVVTTTALTSSGEESTVCARAFQPRFRVEDGTMTELYLVIQCGGEQRGGIDAVAEFNRPPTIQSLSFPDSKFGRPGEPSKICVTVNDPDKDPVEIEWTAAAPNGPQFNGPEIVSNEADANGATVQCVSIVPLEDARYDFLVTAFDDMLNDDGTPIRVEQWLAEHGYPNPSHDTLAFSLISGQPTTKKLEVAVWLPESISTCFIGAPCTDTNCIGLRNDANELTEAFSYESMQSVNPDDPAVQTAAKSVCLDLSVSSEEIAQIKGQLADYQSRVAEWSHGDIRLELRFIEIPNLRIGESRWSIGVYLAPWDIAALAPQYLSFVPDFNLAVAPIRDPQRGLHHDLPACGGTFGADFGLAGAGWSWVPKSGSSFFFECANQGVFTHEWLHQVHWAYHQLSHFDDLYGDTFPPCGQGDPNPRRWFPDSHQCNVDPDYERCGQSDCGDADMVNSHILGQHWDPSVAFVANTCKTGAQDWGETGVDQGGPCLDLTGAAQPIAVPVSKSVPAHASPVPKR